MSSRNGETFDPRAWSCSCTATAPPKRTAPENGSNGRPRREDHEADGDKAGPRRHALLPRLWCRQSRGALRQCRPSIPATNSAWYCSVLWFQSCSKRDTSCLLRRRARASPRTFGTKATTRRRQQESQSRPANLFRTGRDRPGAGLRERVSEGPSIRRSAYQRRTFPSIAVRPRAKNISARPGRQLVTSSRDHEVSEDHVEYRTSKRCSQDADIGIAAFLQ